MTINLTTNANPDPDAPRPITELEQAMINSRRAGKKVEVTVDNSRGTRPLVSLRELTEETGLIIDDASAGNMISDTEAPPAPAAGTDARTERNPVDALRDIAAPVAQPLRSLAEELGKPVSKWEVPVEKAPEPAPVATPAYTAPQPCARCGHRPGEPVFDKPDDADKLAYIESVVLGDRAYEKAYRLYDGKLTLVYESSTHEEYQAGRALVAKKAVLGHFRGDEDLAGYVTTVRTATALRRILAHGSDAVDLPPLPVPADVQDHEQLMALDAAIAKRVTEIGRRFHLAQQCALKFESNYQALTYGALEENF